MKAKRYHLDVVANATDIRYCIVGVGCDNTLPKGERAPSAEQPACTNGLPRLLVPHDLKELCHACPGHVSLCNKPVFPQPPVSLSLSLSEHTTTAKNLKLMRAEQLHGHHPIDPH